MAPYMNLPRIALHIAFGYLTLLAARCAVAVEIPRVPVAVQAILDRHCVKCHGPLEQNAELRLDSAAGIGKGTAEGPVVVAGDLENSKIFRVLAADADPHMPPKKQLSENEIAVLQKWITAVPNEPAATSSRVATSIPQDPTAAIDHFLSAGWRDRQIEPAALCDDRTFVRRVTLDAVGRIPTPEEALAFLFDASPDKRKALVDRLLASDEAARNFREVWDLLLMGRRGNRRDERRRDGGWYAFLEDAFKRDRPWNEVVQTIITARPTQPQDAGAIWFLYERRNDHQQIAEAIAPVIYGTRIDCAQCHDHPLAGEIKQEHYWGLVAAFNRSKNTEKGLPAVQESAAGGFMNFTNLKKESQPAAMVMLTGSKIDEPRPSSDEDTPDRYVDSNAAIRVPKFSRRAVFAEAATGDNALLARSFVNHTWAILMGRGIVDPPDEMNSKHAPSHPELLDWLAADFAAHQYSVRRLIRSIILSRGYQLARPSGNAPPPDAFATALEKPITAEAIARSLQIASGRSSDDNLRQAIAERFPDSPIRPAHATIQQTMFLANSEQMAAIFSPNDKDAAPAASTPADCVRAIFRRALIREPDAEELAHGSEFLSDHENVAVASGQLLWALVAGPEFLTNH
jgi:mono/diheme cytochrome c family protein